MPYRRGDVIAVPYDYSDLTSAKIRPAVVVSSDAYNLARPDVVAAGISSQIAKVGLYDYLLADWTTAGLRYPSLVRGRLLTIEQNLVRRSVGRLSSHDLAGYEETLLAFLISDMAVMSYVLTQIDLAALPGRIIQGLAEKSLHASVLFAAQGSPAVDLEYLRKIVNPPVNP